MSLLAQHMFGVDTADVFRPISKRERDTQSAKPIVGVFLQMPDVARGFSQSPLIRVEPV